MNQNSNIFEQNEFKNNRYKLFNLSVLESICVFILVDDGDGSYHLFLFGFFMLISSNFLFSLVHCVFQIVFKNVGLIRVKKATNSKNLTPNERKLP